MNQLAPRIASNAPPSSPPPAHAQTSFLEFFAAQIHNGHTRRACAQATREFLAWRQRAGVPSIADVTPLHVAATIERLGRERSASRKNQAKWRKLYAMLCTVARRANFRDFSALRAHRPELGQCLMGRGVFARSALLAN